jgi:hypothetical protein
MIWLMLGHALLGLIGAATLRSSDEHQERAAAWAAALGLVLALSTWLARDLGWEWRSVSLGATDASLIAAATGGAWLLVLADPRRHAVQVACIGVAATGLAMFAANGWVVPALLFWTVSSISLIALDPYATPMSRLVLAIADVGVVVALGLGALDAETWSAREALEGWPAWIALVAGILRAGALPAFGVWGLQAASLPLVTVGAFAILRLPGGLARPGVTLVLLVLALGAAAWSAWVKRPTASVLGAWVVALMASCGYLVPEARPRAAVTAAVVVALVSLWPIALGRAGAERALVLALVPATLGFGALIAGATYSFERAVAEPAAMDAAPWAAIAVLLPLAAAAGAWVGATLGRRREPERFEPSAVLATWSLVALALVAGLPPTAELSWPEGGRGTWLAGVAVIVGLAAARFFPHRAAPSVMVDAPQVPERSHVRLPRALRGAVVGATSLVMAGSIAVTSWVTLRGLEVGFL